MRTLLVLGLMFLGCALAVAGEEDDVRAAADAVVAAAKDGDTATLKQVAAAKKPTVWFVLDELCARGAYDAADALAAAAPEAMRKPLAAYAEAQRKVPTPMAHRETYVQFRKAMQAGNLEAALAIDVVPTEPPSVVAVRFLGLRGQALARHRKPAESMQALGQAGQLADDLGWAAESLKLYYEAGMMAARRQDLAGCETYWRPAYAAAKKLGSLPYQAEVGARLAIVLSQRTRNEEALAINREVMPLFVRMGNKSAVASLQMNMGTSLMILGRLEEALEILTKARTALIEAKDARLLAMLTGNMSALYTRLGDYDRALKMKQDALARHRAMGMELEASRILSGMGDHYRQLAEYALAFDYYEQALAGHRKLDNKQGIGFTLGRMGLAHAQLGDGEKARELLQQGLVALDEVGAERIAMHLRSDLADLHTVEGDYEEALALKKEILAAREASGNLTYISDAHQTIATTYGYMGRLEEGLKHVAKALDFAKRAKNDASIAYARICYADLYGRQGKFEKALPHFEATLAYAKEHDDARLENAVYETRVEAAITAKKHGEAVTAALAAADALRRQFRNLGHEERARAGERWVKALVLGVASARHAKDPKAAFRLLEASRASALREALGGGTAIRAAAIPAELRREGAQAAAAEAAAADRLRAATARRTSLKKLRELKKELAAARSRMEAVAVKTERAAKAAANVVQPQPATLADCQRLLGKDRVLVLFTSQG
ncbi:MAG: tetratricopeptide repeat protein, partial [Planctomycetota bacterium]|nr:tetratricopeptide repeat protein [Planctomycetota bacterium]